MRRSSRLTLWFLGLGTIVVVVCFVVAHYFRANRDDYVAPVDSVDSAYSAAGPAQDERKPKIPSTLVEGQGCLAAKCHAPLMEGRYLHGPFEINRCGVCHEQADAAKHEFEPIRNQTKLCSSCHEILMLPELHKPVADGECTSCHDPHHSDNPKLLITKDSATLCARCHDLSKSIANKFVHSALESGDCTGCHNPHSSVNPKLLARRGSNVCFECHEDKRPGADNQLNWHKPVTEDCQKCHDAHASEQPFQLEAPRKRLCLDCHEDIRKRIETSTVFHTALAVDDGCQNCHDPHVSKFPSLLKAPVIDLCLKCHLQPQLREDKSVVKAVGREIRDSKFRHGPIREGDCSGCHDPHGSEHSRLLRGAYPDKLYAPFEKKKYALCFKCHESRAFTTGKTKTLTGFRNGDRNLHFLHVNDDQKGRTCRACHVTHGSDHPEHLADSVPFGSWDMPIEFKKLPRGGSCAPGCHKPREYNVDKPVTYRRTANPGATGTGTENERPTQRKAPAEPPGKDGRAPRTPAKKASQEGAG